MIPDSPAGSCSRGNSMDFGLQPKMRVRTPEQLDFGLQPKEQELLDLLENSDSQLIGYGGARGGAKSHAIRACAVMRRIKYPGTNGVIFRRTYPNLWETHIQRLMIEIGRA